MRRSKSVVLGLLLGLGLGPVGVWAAPPGADPNYRVKGYWDAPVQVQMIPIHSVLARGNGSSQSQLVFWGDGMDVRLWALNPLDELTDQAQLLRFPTDNSDIFCSGHSVLADGRILVTGGTEIARGDFHGLDHVNIFDPQSRTWRKPRPPNLNYPRWYPTNTALPDGRVLVTAGLMYKEMGLVGGVAGGTSTSALQILGLRATPILAGSTVTGGLPPARHDHSVVFDETAQLATMNGFRESQRMILFGGETDAGAPLGDVWALTRNEYDVRAWTQLSPAPDPQYGSPAPRSRHQAVYSAADSTMIVVGGRGAGGAPLGDVWALHLPGTNPTGLHWEKLNPTGAAPELARFGHSVVLDATGHAAPRRLLLFGGQNASGYFNDLWALNLVGTPAWNKLVLHSVLPSARAGQVAIFDPNHERHSLVLFGGGRPDSLFNDVWSCSFHDMADTLLVWRQIYADSKYNIAAPSQRTRATAVYDAQWDRLLVIGGDANGDAPGGELDDIWMLGLDFFASSYQPPGRRHMPHVIDGSPPPNPRDRLSAKHVHGAGLPRLFGRWDRFATPLPGGPRAGLAAAYDPRWLHAHVPEIYDPVADTWQALPEASLWQTPYPDMFLLPSGRLLFAGPSFSTYLLDLTAPAHWITPPWSVSPFLGGTAVQFRPGKVLKAGSEAYAGTTQGAWIDLSGSETATAWQSVAPMAEPRVKHNMTLLPDGDVLVTGGVQVETNPATAVRAPQIWHPDTGTWSAPLAAEGAARDYHSSATLLPDGRIFCGGGYLSVDRANVTVFWPPYLFRNDGSLAPRPVIAAVDTTLDYGRNFTLTTPQAASIGSVSLLRPGAVTHQFNQEQRYVPLSFSPGGPGVLQVSAPANANLAPPGYYLLFIVDTQGVPAVARWVHLGQEGLAAAGGGGAEARAWVHWSANPAAGSPTVTFEVGAAGRVVLDIFDLQGRRVRRLVDIDRPLGLATETWDRADDAGRPVRAGVYFYRLTAGDRRATGRIVLVGR